MYTRCKPVIWPRYWFDHFSYKTTKITIRVALYNACSTALHWPVLLWKYLHCNQHLWKGAHFQNVCSQLTIRARSVIAASLIKLLITKEFNLHFFVFLAQLGFSSQPFGEFSLFCHLASTLHWDQANYTSFNLHCIVSWERVWELVMT